MNSTTATTHTSLVEDTIPWYVQAMRRYWGEVEPNFCDVIASTRGWLPLKRGEEMTIHYDGKEYVITRKK